jgi:hypothetical protein
LEKYFLYSSSFFFIYISTKLRYFQFKILHRYLAVNKLLAQIGIKKSDLCVFCHNNVESIQHLFWDCPEITPLWDQIQTSLLKDPTCFNAMDVILGILNIDWSHLNFVIIHVKYFIYSCKCKQNKPTYKGLLSYLKSCREVEIYIANRSNKLEKCITKWSNINL